MSDPTQLDEDEQRELAALRNRYRREHTDEAGPGAEIDRSIREAARRDARRRWLFTPFPHNWMVPASVVALLLLTISIVHFMPNEPGPEEIVITEDQPPPAQLRKGTEAPERASPAVPQEAPAPGGRAGEPSPRITGVRPMMQDRAAHPKLEEEARPATTSAESDAMPSLEQWTRRIEALLEGDREDEAEDGMRALLEQYPEATFESEALQALALRVRSEE
jgi:hypothetical protein